MTLRRLLSASGPPHLGHERRVGEADCPLADEDLDLAGGGIIDLDQDGAGDIRGLARLQVRFLGVGGRGRRQREAAGGETGGTYGTGRALDQEGTSGNGIHACPFAWVIGRGVPTSSHDSAPRAGADDGATKIPGPAYGGGAWMRESST